MREIKIKNNVTGLKIFVNGVPSVKETDAAHLDVIAEALEKQLDVYWNGRKRKAKDISDGAS